jgi:hypothetical protein
MHIVTLKPKRKSLSAEVAHFMEVRLVLMQVTNVLSPARAMRAGLATAGHKAGRINRLGRVIARRPSQEPGDAGLTMIVGSQPTVAFQPPST